MKAVLVLPCLALLFGCRTPGPVPPLLSATVLQSLKSTAKSSLSRVASLDPDIFSEPTQMRALGTDLLVLDPENQVLVALNSARSIVWRRDLRNTCACKFCADFSADQDDGIVVLDMSSKRACHLTSNGESINSIRLQGSNVPIRVQQTRKGLFANWIDSQEPFAIHDRDGKRVSTLLSALKLTTPESKAGQLIDVDHVWFIVLFKSGSILSFDEEGKPMEVLTLPEPLNEPLSDCTAEPGKVIACLQPHHNDTSKLYRFQLANKLYTVETFEKRLRSLAYSDGLLALESSGRNIWRIQ
jgi:hypothetical protein